MQFTAVPREQMPESLRSVYDRSVVIGDTRFIQASANAPEVMEWYLRKFYGELFYRGRVSVRVKEIARLRLTRSHGCGFCNKWDEQDALNAGIEPEAVDAITAWPEPVDPGPFTGAELAAMKLADEMALQNMDGALSPDLHAQLSEHFNDGDIFELGMVLAVMTGVYKFLFIADLTPKMAHCPVAGALGVSPDWKIEPVAAVAS